VESTHWLVEPTGAAGVGVDSKERRNGPVGSPLSDALADLRSLISSAAHCWLFISEPLDADFACARAGCLQELRGNIGSSRSPPRSSCGGHVLLTPEVQ
jgi:hypothetical protein